MTKINPLKSNFLCANGGPKKCRITCDSCKTISSRNKIRIPKLKDDDLFDVRIHRTGMIETKKALMVRCVKQEIEGVTIPNGFEIWLPGYGESMVRNSFSSIPHIHIPGWKLNGILRMLVLDKLRK